MVYIVVVFVMLYLSWIAFHIWLLIRLLRSSYDSWTKFFFVFGYCIVSFYSLYFMLIFLLGLFGFSAALLNIRY